MENYGIKVKVVNKVNRVNNVITFLKVVGKACENNREEYQLNVESNSITIFALDNAGIFYGIQTLIQLLPIEKSNLLKL